MLSNFASRTTSVNQIVHKLFSIMLKTYFCKLVLGSSLNLDQTTAAQFSGLSTSIIIKNKIRILSFG